MKLRQLVLAGTLVSATWLALFGDRSPATEVIEPARRVSATPTVRLPSSRVQSADADVAVLKLQPRDLLIGSEGDSFSAGTNDAFGSHNWTPPPPPPASAPSLPPPPPQAPPLPFTVLGKSLEEGKWEVYLARSGQTWLVHEKDVIDGAWRVEAIKPPLMLVTYVPLDQVQQLNIGVFD